MTRRSPLSVVLLVSFALLATFSFGQESRFNTKHEKGDDPAGFANWFMKSRAPRNTRQPAAALLKKATDQKMELRASHLRRLQLARQSGKRLAGVNASAITWAPLGPSPIVWGNDATQSWTGRITAVAVDQTDTTGNTVVVGGAYGGVWRTTNATDTPANIKWKSLTDDQPTLSIGSIAIQPDHGSTIVVGTGEPNGALDSYYGMGIMVSNDAGATWTLTQQTSDATPLVFFGKSISSIAFNSRPGHTSNIAAAVSSPGISVGGDDGKRGAVYSTDGGATWHAAAINDSGTTLTASSVMSVVYNPVEDKFFITVRHHGVYVSSDQGQTYTRLANQPNSSVLSVANCPSTYNGTTCLLDRAAMAVRYVKPGSESSSPDELYVWLIGDTNPATGDPFDYNLYQSKNGGTSWTKIDETGMYNPMGGDYTAITQSWYDVYMGAVPNGAGTDLFVGSVNIYKCSITSANPTCTAQPFNNLTHVYDSTCNAFSPNVHPDEHGFDYLGSNPKITYFGNDGGMYRSLDETKLVIGDCSALNVFDSMNADLGSLSQFVWGGQKFDNSTELIGGTQDNGTMYVDSTVGAPGNQGWFEVLGGDGGYGAIDPSDNWYGSNTGVTVQSCPGGWTGCKQWQAVVIQGFGFNSTDGDQSAFYTPFILDPQDPTKIIVGTCRVWRGGNTNASWPDGSLQNALSHKFNSTLDTACGNDASDSPVSALAAGGPKTSAGSKVIYAGTEFGPSSGGGVFLTQNAGAPGSAPTSWTNVTGSINPNGYWINGITVDPHDATGATAVAVIQGFTGGSGKVWRTTNFGAAWTDISGSGATQIPDVPANDVLVDPDNANTIYVATDIGVFVTTDEATWSEIGPNTIGAVGFLPNTTVVHIAMYEKGLDKRLRAWTHGRGAWEAILSSAPTGITASPTSLTFSSTVNVASAAQSVTLTNNDAVDVALTLPPTFSGTAGIFQIAPTPSGTCTATLAAAATCTLYVEFTPTSATTYSSTMSLVTTGIGTPTVSVSLSGTGAAPTATDFSFDASSTTTATVSAGSPASYNLVIDATPSGAVFNPGITFACSGQPTGTACSASPASLTAPGPVVLSVSTTARSGAAKGTTHARNGNASGLLAAALALPGLAFFIPGFTSKSRRKRLLMYMGMMLIVLAFVGMSACGGGSSTSSNPNGTPAGTYTVTVTGTYGTATHTQAITLTVN